MVKERAEMEMVDFAKTPIFARQLKHKAL